VTITTEMKPAISAYSIAVAPLWFVQSFTADRAASE
jgi:hypothetical protein